MIDPPFHYQVTPHADLYMQLRAGEGLGGATWSRATELFQDAYRTLSQSSPLEMIPFDCLIVSVGSVERVRELGSLEGLPDGWPEAIALVGDALEGAGKSYEPVSGPRKETLDRSRERLESLLGPYRAECLGFIAESLGLEPPDVPIPVYLVVDASFPGAFTGRTREGPVSVVSIGMTDLTLVETVLHEATHAMREHERSVPARMLAAQRRAGVGPLDPRSQFWHCVFFVQAAETVRRFIDGSHRDYGETEGYYERVPAVAPAVRRIWTECLQGRLSVDAAVDAMIHDVFGPDDGAQPTGD